MEDLDKIALGRHDRVDILIGTRRFVNYPLVLAAFDARSGGFMIGESEGFPRGPAAHLSAGTMGTAVEALGIALAAHDKTASAHRSGDDPEIAFTGTNRALACHQNVLTEMALSRDIVVMAVDRLNLGLSSFTAESPVESLHRRPEHDLPVCHREVLRPPHRLNVIVEVTGALWQVGKIGIRQIDEPPAHMFLGALDKIGTNRIPDAPAP